MSQAGAASNTLGLVLSAIASANRVYSDTLDATWREKVLLRASALEASKNPLQQGNLNVVIFHVKIPVEASKIKAPDIQNLDHDKFDYETLIRFNIDLALKTNPRCRVILVTDATFLQDITQHTRLRVCRVEVNALEPMFERVLTMAAYINSRIFDQPTVFLDSDAFLLRPVHNVFANSFDVGVTHRNILGQMPINEGVLFANNLSKERVQKFFEAYLASYLAIEKDGKIGNIYENLRRWRGGQLSVNSAANGGQVYATGLSTFSRNFTLVHLPCSAYNLSEIQESEVTAELSRRCAVLHLKGMRKSWLEQLRRNFLH